MERGAPRWVHGAITVGTVSGGAGDGLCVWGGEGNLTPLHHPFIYVTPLFAYTNTDT